MLVLHAALDGNALLFWTEPHDDVDGALGRADLHVEGERVEIEAKLPKTPSTPLVGKMERGPKEAVRTREFLPVLEKAAGERVIVMGHYPIYPVNPLNLWDDVRLVELLTSYDNFLLYINGHNHVGNFGAIGRKYFVNFKGMVETPDTTTFSIVGVYDDRIDIRAFGAEQPRTLAV